MTPDDNVDRKTTLRSTDAPPHKRLDNSEHLQDHYDRLKRANSLRWNGKWRDEKKETQKNASAILDATASTLELTDHQKREAHRVFSTLPTEAHEGNSTRLLALCTCGLVGRADGRDYHPNLLRPNDPDYNAPDRSEFVELVAEIGASYKTVFRCWKRVEAEVDL